MTHRLEGNWSAGLAFDLHTVSSIYLGEDEFGHDRFENTRSAMGDLVYRLKYRQDESAVGEIIELLKTVPSIESFDLIIPVPATKHRALQPVPAIAHALGKQRGVEVREDLLTNKGTKELKEVTDPVERERLLKESIALTDASAVAGKKVLLIDDLFRSGSTLMVATDILLKQGKAGRVCVLTMTKTRSNR